MSQCLKPCEEELPLCQQLFERVLWYAIFNATRKTAKPKHLRRQQYLHTSKTKFNNWFAVTFTLYHPRINSTREQVMEIFQRYSTDALTSQCNLNCRCSIDKFIPVCGSNDIVYASPCHAGCTARFDNKVSNAM